MNYKKYEVRVHEDGSKSWHLNGKLHREDGPAIEWFDGTKEWYLDNKHHREGGPAVEWSDGSKYWFQQGKQHRERGPAIEDSDGTKMWWLDGKRLSEQEHTAAMKKRNNSCAGKIVEIEGKKYKLTEV